MLVTRQNRIPFSWVIMAMLPWAFFYFQITLGMVSFFILNRLIENPAALTFVLSLPGLILTFLPLGSFISYTSDRIWTRWGRRRPFIIAGFAGWAMVLSLYPLAPNVWIFVGLTFLFSLFGALNAPLEALKLETIPPPMRGRSAALWQWITTIMNITFWSMVIGRIDEVIPVDGAHLSGDKILYWAASGGLLIALFIYLFGIREVDPKSTITGEKFSFKKLIKALTMKELRYLYLLLFATSMLNAGLGSLGMLMYTEQWSYSNQEMGFNIAVGGVINLFLIPLVGIFADKGSRMRIYVLCMIGILTLKVFYFGYVTWYLPDQRPSLVEVIFFGETMCIFGIIASVVYYPLVYDYIPRNLMGTYFAGAGILGSIIGFVTLNGAGTFLLWWANLYQPPGGEMVRVCLARESDQTQVEQTLRNANLRTPDGSPARPEDIVARAWYGDGVVSDSGTCFEIRLRDDAARDKLKRNGAIKGEISTLDGKLKLAQSQGDAPEKISSTQQELQAKKDESKALEAEMETRTAAWRAEVLRGLEGQVITPGAEILASTAGQAVTARIPILRKPKEVEIERLNRSLRHEDPAAIGVRVLRDGRTFALAIATIPAAGATAEASATELAQRLAKLAAVAAPGLMADSPALRDIELRPLARLDIALVEIPVTGFVSLISRGVNACLSPFTEIPPLDRKLHALARSVAQDAGAGTAVCRIDQLDQGRKGLHVYAVAQSAQVDDQAAWTATLTKTLIAKAPDVKLTVPVPVVAANVVAIKYNYFVGYLWMIVLTTVGLGLIWYFIRQEKAGKIHKLGAAEAHAEKTAEDARTAADTAANAADPSRPGTARIETYTPGYLVPKILLALAGLLVAAFAVRELTPGLRLLTSGTRTEAVATAVIVTKPGFPEERYETQTALKAKLDAVTRDKDYTWVFWTEFTFDAADGNAVTFRRDVGCKLKPSIPLLDDGGLPTTALVLYDPADTTRTCLPLEYSTWFAPVLVLLISLIATAVGCTLAWFARKPIQLS